MAKKLLFSLIMGITIICGFSSCEDDPYYDETIIIQEQLTYDLCYYIWSDWYIVDGLDCEQQLTFDPDGKGLDIRKYHYPTGRVEVEEIPFLWHWDSYYTDVLYMDYHDGRSVMESIRIDGRRLDCMLDGEWIKYKAL